MPGMADYGLHESGAFPSLPDGGRTATSLEEYLGTSYSSDREYRDGVVLERNAGDKEHSLLQSALAHHFWSNRKRWSIAVYTGLRVQVRPDWWPLPGVCVYTLPGFEGRYPSHPPFLWIEILSRDDKMLEVWGKAKDLIQAGVPRVWIIDPLNFDSELWTPEGALQVTDKTLTIPGSPIVVPLRQIAGE